MSFPQRFRYNSIVQRYALFSDLWRQKLKIKEEGYRRPQDAALGIAGMREQEERAAAAALAGEPLPEADEKPFIAHFSDVDAEHDRVQELYQAMLTAKQKAGESAPGGDLNSFKQFVKKKTDQLRKDYGCHAVEYSVELDNGQVKLKAKAKV